MMYNTESLKRSVVLLSSGLDSSVNFLMALRKTEVVLALTFDYGQRAAPQEISYSRELCRSHEIRHEVVELPWLKALTKTSLVNRSQSVPTHVPLGDLEKTHQSAQAVWVPNRNGVFLNIAASFAESLGANLVIPGFNKEEATTFPDNSDDFMDAASAAFFYSTANHVEVMGFTSHMDKSEIVHLGQELGLNFNRVWSCYFGDQQPCGVCESCLRFQKALSTMRPRALSAI